MVIPTLARKIGRKIIKLIFFILIFVGVGRILPKPDDYINYSFGEKVCTFIYGDINADNMYDAYFYIDMTVIMLIAIAVYFITMKLIRK
jgi:hypothetical protein